MTSRHLLACSTAAIALLAAAPLHAQTATGTVVPPVDPAAPVTQPPVGDTQAADAAAAPDPSQDIVVTGLRASLERAQTLKRNNSSVVEAVSAEDIGKLPQSSVADSLGRLAGLAGERRSGRISGISVRGFREDFVGTTLNGRELIGIGDNRGVEYDLYPAEIVSAAVVYKTPDAGLTAMGVGGTVDIRTVRPLERSRALIVNGTYEKNGMKSKNPDFDDQGYRFALSYTDKFADDTIGIALTAATTSSPVQDDFFSVWGYDKNAITSGPNAGKYVAQGIDISSRSRVLKRDTIAGVFQYRPSDAFTATFDALYINFADQGISRGFIEALPVAADGSGVLASNSTTVTSARTTGFNSVIRSDPLDKTGDLKVFGGNLAWKASSNLDLTLDVSRSESKKSDTRAESYAGLGRAGLATQGANNIRTWTYTDEGLLFSNNSQSFDDYNRVKLAGPQSWGGSLAPITELNTPAARAAGIGFAQAQDGFVNTARFDEYLNAARLEAAYRFDGGFLKSINVALRYSDHKKSKVNQGFFLTAQTYPSDGPVPEDSRNGLADLNWAGLGNVVAYDALGLINSDFYRRWDAGALEPDRLGDTYSIKETVWQPSVKAEFESDLGGVRMFGNVGVQGLITNQRATGFDALVVSNLRVRANPVEDGAKYTRVLPSLNTNFDLGGGHTIRFALAKVVSRPRIDFLNPGSSVKFSNNVANVTNTNPELGPWTSRSGNAQLRPYEADQADLSYEYYFASDGFVSISAFYKDLKNWNVQTTTIRDFREFYIPGYHQAVSSDGQTIYTPATFQGLNTTYVGGLKGKVKGIELQASLPFGRFVSALDGFGLTGGAAFTDGKLDDGSRIPGLSARVFQGTAYFEKSGFSARVSANNRSSWLSEDRGGSNSISPANRSGQTLVDAQIGFDFANTNIDYLDHLRLSFQAQNLTNQRDVYTDAASGLTTRRETFGRNFLVNLTYAIF
ncbi:TonB-dependent receptor [Sphingomonas yantingensis]|uniref:Iron complex outermembrane receptor protein n=1 Tax=Sphingomonas yantingensis TaxID=1241761 RepID=A0A7W9AQ94_9SPHN|nr:TonB-dependent receptor [Sphingomonas yantingensis]MBB5698560.1 iron complex outermembrane receptor protein [Sphingomonas yantingensis]